MGKIEAIVFDVFGTLIGGARNEFRRLGVPEFLEQNPDVRATFFTDAKRDHKEPLGTMEEQILTALEEIGVLSELTRPFFYCDSMDERYKDLSKVAKEFGVNVENIVMIGDSYRSDAKSAEKYGSKIVLVNNLMETASWELGLSREGLDQPTMPMDHIGNLDALLGDQKAAKFEFKNGIYQPLVGDYEAIKPKPKEE